MKHNGTEDLEPQISRSIITTANDVRSSDEFLKSKLSKIKHYFVKINGYPSWVFNQIHQKLAEHKKTIEKIFKSKTVEESSIANNIVLDKANKVHMISLPPYNGENRLNIGLFVALIRCF